MTQIDSPAAPRLSPREVSPTAIDDALAGKVGGSAKTLLVRKVFTMALGALTTGVLARVFGVADFGAYSAALAAFYIAVTAADLGFSSVLLRDLGISGADAGRLVRTAIRVMSAWSVVPAAILVGLAVAAGLHSGRGQALALFGLGLPVAGFSLLRPVFIASYETRTLAKLDMSLAVVQSVALIAVAAAGFGVVGVAAAMVATTGLTTLVVARRGFRLLRGRDGRASGHRGVFRTAAPVGLSSLLATLYFSIDLVLLGWLVSEHQLGLYAVGVKVLSILVVIPATVLTAALPGFSEADGPDAVGRIAARAWHWLLALALPLSAAVFVFAEQVVLVLFGPDFEDGVMALRVLTLASIVAILASILGMLLIAQRRIKQQIALTVAMLAFNVVGNVLLVPTYGIMASAWTTVVTEILACSGAILILRGHVTGLPALRVTLRPLLAVLAASTAGYALLDTPLVAIGVAAVTYVALVLGLRAWPSELRIWNRGAAAASSGA